MTAALRFFVLIEVLGLAATPLAAVALARWMAKYQFWYDRSYFTNLHKRGSGAAAF